VVKLNFIYKEIAMDQRKESHQYYHDHPTCECGQILISPDEIATGLCCRCMIYKWEDYEEVVNNEDTQ